MHELGAPLQGLRIFFCSLTHGYEDLPWARKAQAYSLITSLRDDCIPLRQRLR